MKSTNYYYDLRHCSHQKVFTLINQNKEPFEYIEKRSDFEIFPQTGNFFEMKERYESNPSQYLGLAIVYDWRLDNHTGGPTAASADGLPYGPKVMSMINLCITTKQPDFGVVLNNGPKSIEIKGDPIQVYPSFKQFTDCFDYTYLLIEGSPVSRPGAIAIDSLREKHESILEFIATKQESIDFWKLFRGNTSQFGHDIHAARMGYLRIVCQFVRFDMQKARELFECSALCHPNWLIPNHRGVVLVDQMLHQIFSGMNIHHSMDIEGFIKLHYPIRYNVVTARPEIYKQKTWLPVDDYSLNSIHRHIKNKKGKISISDLKGLLTSNYLKSFHPFKEYFEGLDPYDSNKEPDYIEQLANTVSTSDTTYWKWTLRRFLIGVVATAVSENECSHQVLVLQSSSQGIGKTRWIERLLPDTLSGYMYSGPFDPSSKDSIAHLAECLLINLDELDSLGRKKEAELKEVITKTTIRYRRPYGYFADTHKRHASFLGSVNHDAILHDSSGSRRFLVHKVQKINYQHSIDIDRVWAQAYYHYNQGEKYWFDGQDIQRIQSQNQEYEVSTVEEELLLKYFERTIQSDSNGQWMTTTDILRKVYGEQLPTVTNSASIRLGKALSKHNFLKKRGSAGTLWRVKSNDIYRVR